MSPAEAELEINLIVQKVRKMRAFEPGYIDLVRRWFELRMIAAGEKPNTLEIPQ